MKRSIKRQLLLWLLVPLVTLALLSTIAANFLGLTLARTVYDKQLINSADSVAARIRTRDDKVTVDLPPAAQSILRHNYHDEFYFQVRSPSGTIIAGDNWLPAPQQMHADSEPNFRSVSLNNRNLRVVCVSVPTPDLSFGHVVIQAGETRNTRTELAGQITMSILLAQLVLIASGAAAIWVGVGRGLMPLMKVERAVAARAPGDLSALQVDEPVEIASLITALNRLFKQLQEDVDAQCRFTSNAAHQLRTPLAILGTYCDLAKKLVSEEKNCESLEVLNELESGINRMCKLVNRLLALARAEPNLARKEAGSLLDLNLCASQVCAGHVPEALGKKIRLEFQAASEPALVYGDPPALEELISNLIENCILYTPSGGNVIVGLIVRESRITLTIADDGPGIPLHEREHVFERFYRIGGTEEQGTGLGLSIVKEIATAHSAEVQISAGAGGKGTTFAVSFPASSVRTGSQDALKDGNSKARRSLNSI